MTQLSDAPLIEAIVEMRWGKSKHSANGPTEFHFPPEDTEFFPGQFFNVAAKKGFIHVERINKEVPSAIPHIVRYRFRRKENTWPVYQIGLGLFVANQAKDGYDWDIFFEDIKQGLGILDEGHPVGLSKLPAIGIEMRYQDGFLLEDGETPSDFLTKKLNIGFTQPKKFIESPSFKGMAQCKNITFTIESVRPKGLIMVNVIESLINGKKGMVMDTMVRSTDDSKPNFDMESLSVWLEEAHNIQSHAFKTLINPAFARSFNEARN